MCARIGGLVATLAVVLGSGALGDDDDPLFVSVFDGKTLEGWAGEHTDRYRVRDGMIANDGGSGWLRYDRRLRDFEFRAEFRVVRRGTDSGLIFRASAESLDKDPYWPAKGYQLEIVDTRRTFAILGLGVPPPKFHRKTEVLKTAASRPGQWETIGLRVIGRHAEATLNGKLITVSDTIDLRDGCIGLRGENGRFEWRNLQIRELTAPETLAP